MRAAGRRRGSWRQVGRPFGERGPDGDHFFFMQVPGDDALWVWFKSNF
jgi:hypothetical protein